MLDMRGVMQSMHFVFWLVICAMQTKTVFVAVVVPRKRSAHVLSLERLSGDVALGGLH